MAERDALLDDVDALIGKLKPETGKSTTADEDDPVLKEVDALIAPYEVHQAEREAASSALEVGKWPGDEAIRPAIEKGSRKAFNEARDARIPQMRQVTKARQTETALREQDSFTNRATEFAKSLFAPSEAPAPIAQTPPTQAPLPVPAAPRLSPSPLHTTPMSPERLVSDVSKADKSAAGNVLLAYKRREIEIDQAYQQLREIYGRYTNPDDLDHPANGLSLRDVLTQTKRRPINPETITADELPSIADMADRYKAANPLEQGPKVGPDKLHPFERASAAPADDQADDYDYEAARAAGVVPRPDPNETAIDPKTGQPYLHWDSKFKKDHHPHRFLPSELGVYDSKNNRVIPADEFERIATPQQFETVQTEKPLSANEVNGYLGNANAGKESNVQPLELPEILVRPGDNEPGAAPSWLQPGLANNYEQAEVLNPAMPRPSMPAAGTTAEASGPSLGESLAEAANNFMRGAADVSGSAFKAIAIASKTLDDYVPEALKNPADIKERLTYKIGQAVQDMAKQAFPTDPTRQKEFLVSVLPRALGSMSAFLVGGLGGALVKAPMTTTATMGALAQGTEQFEDAAQHGADPSTQEAAFWLGVPVGTTEALPIGGLIDKFNKATGGRFMHVLKTAGAAAAEEFAQEFFQTTAGNVIAKDILEYDTQRSRIEGATEAGEAGGAAGGILGILMGALGVRRARTANAQTGAADVPAANEPLAQGPPASAPATVSAPPPIEGVPAQAQPAPVDRKAQPKPAEIERAKALIKDGALSAATVQQQLRVGYPRAARIVEELKQQGLVQTPAPVERPAAVEKPAPIERPKPTIKPDAITPEMREAMDYVTEYEVQERPTAVQTPIVKKPTPTQQIDKNDNSEIPPVETSTPVEKPEVAPESRAEVAPAQEAAPLPIPAKEESKPTPDRTRNVFLGKNGNRRITFADPIHAELFDFTSALKKSLAGDKSVDMAHRTSRLKKQLGLPDDANVGDLAQTYRKQILEQAKAAEAGQMIAAPAPFSQEVNNPEAESLQSALLPVPKAPIDIVAQEAATSLQNDRPQPTDAQKEAGNYKKAPARIGGLDLSIENPLGSYRYKLDTKRIQQVADALGKSGSQEGRQHATEIADALRILKDGEAGAAFEKLQGIERNTFKQWPDLSEALGETLTEGWQTQMKSHYGYIKGTVGKDKDHIDVFVKPGTPDDYNGPVFVVDQQDPKTKKFDEHKVVLGAADAREAAKLYEENYAKNWRGMGSMRTFTMDEFKQWVYDPKATKQRAVDYAKPAPTAAELPIPADEPKGVTQQPRSELPIEQNMEMLLRAEKAQADMEIAGEERGGRFFIEKDGQGSTQDVVGLKSPTAPWYKELTKGPAPLKREQIEKAIQKIIQDEGSDVGKAVERVKEVLLRDREFNKTPWGEDADAIMRGEWPSWIPKPEEPESFLKPQELPKPKAKAEDKQTSIEIPPETIGSRPIIGRETTPEESPLFSKAAQEEGPEQAELPVSAKAPDIVAPSPNFQDARSAAVDAEKAFNQAATLEEKRKYLDRVAKLKKDYLDAARINSEDYKTRAKFFDDIISRMNREDLPDAVPTKAEKWNYDDAEPMAATPGEPIATYGDEDNPKAQIIESDDPDVPGYQVQRDDETYVRNPEAKRDAESHTFPDVPSAMAAYDKEVRDGKRYEPKPDAVPTRAETPVPAKSEQSEDADREVLRKHAQQVADTRKRYVTGLGKDADRLFRLARTEGKGAFVNALTQNQKNVLKSLGTSPEGFWKFVQDNKNTKPPSFYAPRTETPAPAKSEASLPVPAEPEAPAKDPDLALTELVDGIVQALEKGTAINAVNLFEAANKVYGGTTAEGKYTPKDAYDALELGVNKYIATTSTSYSPDVPTIEAARRLVEELRAIVDKLPTQTRRTDEQIEFQQFSTPPDLAFVMNWAGNVSRQDTMLEPSAGLGGLAVFAHDAGAKVVMNEYNDRRAALLKKLNIGKVFTENAEQLDNILPASIKPTVIIMNPPFSSAAGRIEGQRKTTNGLAHLEQALDRLEPGGRLVALIGKGKRYSDPLVLERWIADQATTHAYRARIGLSGKGYKKYGTNYDNQILIFDKIQPDGREPVIAEFDDVLEALPSLKEVRDVRTTAQPRSDSAERPTAQSDRAPVPETGASAARPDTAVSPAAAPVGDRAQEGETAQPGLAGSRAGKPQRPGGKRSRAGDAVSDQQPAGSTKPVPDTATAAQSDESAGSGQGGDERPGSSTGSGSGSGRLPAEQVSQKLAVEQGEKRKRTKQLGDSVFEEYVPAKFKVKGAKPHPGKLAESAALAAVEPPDITYRPHLPQSLIEEGVVSLPQLEAVALSGQAHQSFLPNGERKGAFIGDGPGVGKGRTISAIIMDNWNQGRKKALWLSETQNLYNSAIRDWTALGGKEQDLHVINKTKLGEPLGLEQGLMFMTYSTMGSGIEVTRSGEMKAKQVKGGKPTDLVKTRLDQVGQWLGKDYDGVIVFDEAHNMQNAMAEEGEMGDKPPAARALAGVELQRRFPKARIVYSSATGATKIEALAYAERLGLWGPGTAFPNKEEFLTKIGNAGLGAMEIVAQNLKANGVYISRNLSYDGVTYDKIEHELTPDQQTIYNEMGKAWQVVFKNVQAAMEETGVIGTSKSTGAKVTKNSRAKAAAMGKFYGTQLRFYNQVLNAMQMPSVLKDMKARLTAGESVIVQLTNTNESALKRELEKLGADPDADLGGLDLSPKQDLIAYVKKAFPVQQMEEFKDADGNMRTRAVMDSQGRPVENRKAVQRRDALVEQLESIRVPDSPLDQILNTFGPEMVAEITGRKERVMRYTDKRGERREVREKGRTDALRREETKEFLADKRQILVFSDKGGTGESYHADLSKKNQRLRNHYVVQAGWRADKTVQALGRSHRSNQKQPPRYILTMTNIKGHKRFISTVARRLDQLGALTQGNRQAGSSGLIDAKDNLENVYATRAIKSLVKDVLKGVVPDIKFNTLTDKLGLDRMIDPRDGRLVEENIPDVPKFMNRLLSLEIPEQNLIFDEFIKRMERLIEIAASQGELDTGMETIRAAGGIREVQNEQIYTDPNSSAKVNLVTLEATHKTELIPFGEGLDTGRYVRSIKTGKVWAARDIGTRTRGDGSVEHEFRLSNHKADSYKYVDVESFGKNYQDIDKKTARQVWDEQMEAEPKTYTRKFAMVTGSILNIWDKLGEVAWARIVRTQTVDGDVYVGMNLSDHAAGLLKVNLGVSSEIKVPDYTPAQFAEQVVDNGATLTLNNGWTVRRARVANEARIEIQGDNLFPYKQELTDAGAFGEVIGSQRRYFVPTGSNAGSVLGKILKLHPVAEFLAAAKKAIGNERGSVPLSNLVPGKTERNDQIQGLAANEVVAFDQPETEERFLKAKEGVKPETARQKIRQALEQIAHSTREFPTLPDTAEYSPLRTSLLTLQKQKGVAADRVIRRLERITGQLGPKKLDLFTRKVMLDDLVREAEQDRDLPFGLTAESAQRNLEEIDRLVSQNQDVAEAVAARTAAWQELKGRYGKAMRAIGQDRLADRLNKANYFRHQVLEYAQTRQRTPAGTGKELKSPTGRGFLRQRHGSTLDINANYLQADFEVMAQMEHDVEVAKTIRLVDRKYNIRPQLEQKAKRQNEQSLQARIAAERFALFGDVPEGTITSPTPIEAQLKEYAKQIAMGLSKVRRAMEIPKHGIITFSQLSAWAEDEESPANVGARQALKGISERRKYVKDLLGRDFKTWDDLIPEGYTTWQPEQGNVLFLAESIPQQLARQLHEAILPSVNISAEQLRKVMAMGGPKEQYVVDMNVHDTLRSMARPIPAWWQSAIRSAQGHWKQVMLIAPRRLVRYNLRNLTGDADAIFAGNPSAFRQLGRSLTELWPAFFGKTQELRGEVKEWFDRGGFQSTLQAQEMGDLNELRVFRALLEKEAKGGLASLPARLINSYWTKARLATDYREAILRYANYLEYLEQMRANPQGAPKNWGASIPDNVMALDDVRDRAYKMSNELLGAYDRVSAIGQNLRNYWIPFFSWTEVNFRRYRQLAKNAFKDIGAAKLSRFGLVGAGKSVKWMIRFAALWTMLQVVNNLFFPDEERELDETTRNKPHIIFGRDEKGKIMYLSGLGAMGDLLSWFGLDEAPAITADVMHGRLTPGEALKNVAKAPINKIVQGITPLVKVPAEMFARESTYPDVFRPRAIQDRGEYLAQQFTLGPEYRKATGLPGKSYLGSEDLTGLVVQRQDPGSAAYSDWQNIENKWLERFGKTKGIHFRGEKSTAIRNIARAIQEGDTEAEARWRQKFEDLGGSVADIKKSVRALAPLAGVTKAERATILAGIDGEERAILKRAETYYKTRMLQVLPELERRKLLGKLTKQGWLRPEEPDVATFPLE